MVQAWHLQCTRHSCPPTRRGPDPLCSLGTDPLPLAKIIPSALSQGYRLWPPVQGLGAKMGAEVSKGLSAKPGGMEIFTAELRVEQSENQGWDGQAAG